MRSPRATTLLLTALVAAVSAWPAGAQSPSAEPSPSTAPSSPDPSAISDEARPMLAPAGWLLTARDGDGTVTVIATSPAGEQRPISIVREPGRPAAGEPTPARLLRVLPATVDGMLPLVFETEDGQDGGRALHLVDLLSPDLPPVVAVWADGQTWWPIEEATSGPDGRMSWETDPPDGSDPTALLDPMTGQLTEIDTPRSVASFARSQDWLESSRGWPAVRDDRPGILTDAGTFRPTSAPYPLVDLARGALQVSASGKDLRTWDIGSTGTTGPALGPCRRWWTETGDPSIRPTEIWWNRCRDTGRVLDIRWDVDGEGVLILAGDQGRIRLLRRDQPGEATVLATINDPAVEAARKRSRDIEVLGLAPGPRPDELLLAFSPVDHFDSVFFLSTIEGTVHEVPGTFAGFVEPPIDRDVADLTPFAHRVAPVPTGMVAPSDWMLAWVAGPVAADGARALRVVALGPDGTVREVATLDGILGATHQLPEDATDLMRVTTTGHLPVPVAATADAPAPAAVHVVDLHDPAAAPLTLTDAPERAHDWSTLRSSASGRLSVRLTEDPFPDRGAIQDLSLPDGGESLVPIAAGVEVDPDPLRTSDGWPAWDATDAGVLDRSSAEFVATTGRGVSLARGAQQQARNGSGLWRVVPANAKRNTRGCPTGVVRSGIEDGTGPVWWNPCNQPGGLLDIRWDTDGAGALVLVRRGDTVRLLRERRPGRFDRVGSFPVAAIGGPDAVRGLTVAALMDGPLPGELVLALQAGRRPWRWSSLTTAPVPLPTVAGETAGFAGFSVEPGDPR